MQVFWYPHVDPSISTTYQCLSRLIVSTKGYSLTPYKYDKLSISSSFVKCHISLRLRVKCTHNAPPENVIHQTIFDTLTPKMWKTDTVCLVNKHYVIEVSLSYLLSYLSWSYVIIKSASSTLSYHIISAQRKSQQFNPLKRSPLLINICHWPDPIITNNVITWILILLGRA